MSPRERFIAAMSEIGQKDNVHALRQAAEAFADEAGKTDCMHLMNDHLPHCPDCRSELLKEIGL